MIGPREGVSSYNLEIATRRQYRTARVQNFALVTYPGYHDWASALQYHRFNRP